MIRPTDGKYCPICRAYINPWTIYKAIGRRESGVFCPECQNLNDIDDLIDADEIEV